MEVQFKNRKRYRLHSTCFLPSSDVTVLSALGTIPSSQYTFPTSYLFPYSWIQVKQVSAAPGTIFEVAEQSGDWMRVLMGNEASAWMISKAQGMSLLRPARREHYVMDPAVRPTTVA